MKNVNRKGWTRSVDTDINSVTYSREQGGIATYVEFDDVTMTYTVTTQDLETYENDLRLKVERSFTSTESSISGGLAFAETVSHHQHSFLSPRL